MNGKSTYRKACKRILFVLVIACVLGNVAITARAATKNAWKKGCYYDHDGEKVTNSWVKYKGNKYLSLIHISEPTRPY